MKIRNPLLIKLGTRLATFGMRMLFRTASVEMRQEAPRVTPYAETDEKYLYCIWHDGIIGVLFSGRTVELAGLTSRHADGALVAGTMDALNIPAVRGSSGASGAAAIREIRDDFANYHVAITVDGPRGPRREVKDGIIYLASRTGRKIVPVAFEASSAWRPRGRWTDMTIPKPFSRVTIAGGVPIEVPPKLRREGLEEYRRIVQEAADDLTRRIEAELLDRPREDFVVKNKMRRAA